MFELTLKPRPTFRPISNDEAMVLDRNLKAHISDRLKTYKRHSIAGQNRDDIANTSWERALGQPFFRISNMPVRNSYLQTTANNHMVNLIRMEDQRTTGLNKNREKVMWNFTVLRVEQLEDRIFLSHSWGASYYFATLKHCPDNLKYIQAAPSVPTPPAAPVSKFPIPTTIPLDSRERTRKIFQESINRLLGQVSMKVAQTKGHHHDRTYDFRSRRHRGRRRW